MRFEIGFDVQHDAFTIDGNIPEITVWIGYGSSFNPMYMRRPGLKLNIGLFPIRIAWNGRWIYHPKSKNKSPR